MPCDSDTTENMKKTSMSEVTDDSCTTETVHLCGASDDYCTQEFTCLGVKVKEELANENDNGDPDYPVKQEPADEYDNEILNLAIQVRCAFLVLLFCQSVLLL